MYYALLVDGVLVDSIKKYANENYSEIFSKWVSKYKNVVIVECKTDEELDEFYYDEEDITQKISDQLEDGNYHEFTLVPFYLLNILREHIEDEQLVKKIMLQILKEKSLIP